MIKAKDRVVFKDNGAHGTVAKTIDAQGTFHAMSVVDFDNGVRGTVRTADLEKEEK
jgi:hypothetical protein